MKKILILIAVHGRHNITKQCYNALQKFIKQTGHQYQVLVVGNDQEHKIIAEHHGFKFFWYENFPVGRKLNAALTHAMQFDWDYLMQLGSDDIILPGIMQHYQPYFDTGTDVFGVDNCIFVHQETGRAKWFKYNKPDIIGAGRCISRKAIESTCKTLTIEFTQQLVGPDFHHHMGEVKTIPALTAQSYIRSGVAVLCPQQSPYILWKDSANRSLDHYSSQRLKANGYTFQIVPADKMIIDLKSKENIWSYDSARGVALNYEEVKKLLE
jgi:hypothetical protein